MSGMLSRLSSRQSIGILVEDRRIAICVVGTTSGGRRRPVACQVHDRGEEPLADELRRLLEPLRPAARSKKSDLGPWVQVGIADAHAFQAVVPITQANRNAGGAVLLPRGRAGDQHPRRRIG